MLARLWRICIDPARADEYDYLVARHLRPMFAALDGCLGTFFIDSDPWRSVLTLWQDRVALEVGVKSALYRQTAERLASMGISQGAPVVHVQPITGGTLDVFGLSTRLRLTNRTVIDGAMAPRTRPRRIELVRDNGSPVNQSL